MRGWRDFGVVETIYEEEQEDASNSSPIPLNNDTAISRLHIKVQAWFKATGTETDVTVRVHGRCFRLHKEPIVARSRYLKRRLTEANDVALDLPAQITAEAFAVVACFCYGSDIAITPFNVIALRVAAELLEMTEDGGGGGGEENLNLRGKTESYFCQAVAVNHEYASLMLRSCVELLPEAEETAFLASRCIEALVSNDGVSDSWMCDLNELAVEEFLMIADSMKGRLAGDHDILYRAVDMYLKRQQHTGSLTEDQKIRICAVVDCNKLSHHLLMHAVQNPIMPLRFVIRAMLVEQLNTRRSVYSAAACAPQTQAHTHKQKQHSDCITLGTILHRDAALRHIAQLKTSMEATSARIVSLEDDLTQMRKQLQESETRRAMLESTRSASFRFSWEDRREKKEKRKSVPNPRNSRSLSKILITGLRNMFHVSKTDSERGSSSEGGDDEWPPPRHKKIPFA